MKTRDEIFTRLTEISSLRRKERSELYDKHNKDFNERYADEIYNLQMECTLLSHDFYYNGWFDSSKDKVKYHCLTCGYQVVRDVGDPNPNLNQGHYVLSNDNFDKLVNDLDLVKEEEDES